MRSSSCIKMSADMEYNAPKLRKFCADLLLHSIAWLTIISRTFRSDQLDIPTLKCPCQEDPPQERADVTCGPADMKLKLTKRQAS